ncbi:hypothetical protein [Paludisphaera sp.]|uniref:hypothetical protein n=1 Tax=Paludisphaera sp. TaxID=2017432 RepID=UPI00301C50D2
MIAATLSLPVSGCGSASGDGLNRKAVSGRVTVDGTPLAKGVIAFEPAEGSSGGVPAGGVVIDGAYSIDATSGPTPGKYKVSIRSAPTVASPAEKAAPGAPPRRTKGEADSIPAKYNTASELTAEVAASGATSADFALVTK